MLVPYVERKPILIPAGTTTPTSILIEREMVDAVLISPCLQIFNHSASIGAVVNCSIIQHLDLGNDGDVMNRGTFAYTLTEALIYGCPTNWLYDYNPPQPVDPTKPPYFFVPLHQYVANLIPQNGYPDELSAGPWIWHEVQLTLQPDESIDPSAGSSDGRIQIIVTGSYESIDLTIP